MLSCLYVGKGWACICVYSRDICRACYGLFGFISTSVHEKLSMLRGGESQARECTCESEWHIVLANLWYAKRPMSVAGGTGRGPALNCVKHRAFSL